VLTFDAVKELVLELPEVEEATSWDMPALKVRKKLFARLREEGDVLVVKIDRHEREALIQSQPDTFFVTPHYENYPYVLVRLDEVDRGELRELLIEAWRMAAPRRLVAAYDSGTGPGV
jgi:hypothetical protein